MLDRAQTVAVDFTLNGAPVSVTAPPFQPLSETLREGLRLMGTKVGCEAGDCGACTVLVDGRQACACLVPIAQVEGSHVETIEGDGPDGLTRRLKDAFLAHGAAQCGICTPGMIMAAADYLARTREATRGGVEDALGGVLCRCTGYQKITDAVMAVAAGPGLDALEDIPAEADRPMGARIARLDGRAKVEGTDRFGADAPPQGALWVRVIRSPHPAARFTLGDLSAFEATHPGVRVLTARDVPGLNGFGIFPKIKDQPVFADGRVRFRGEAVAALVGPRETVEAIPIAAFPISYMPEVGFSGLTRPIAEGTTAPALFDHLPDNVLTRGNLKRGDVAAGHAAGVATVEGAFQTSFVEHAYIEPEAGHAVKVGERMEVTACTQAPYMDLEETARVLGVSQDQVRIIPTACGGGFGGKLDVSIQPILAVAAAVTGEPVRIIYSRTESMASTTKRHPAAIHAKASADAEGRLTAFEFEGDFNTGAYASWGPTVANRVPVHATGPYRVPHVWNRTRAILTNDTPAGAFRGFGVPQAAIAHETLLDDLAERLGLDRWAIRRLNAIRAGDTTPTGQVLEASAGLPECLDALKPTWDAALARVARHNAKEPRLKRGVGVACMWYGCGNTSMSNPSKMRVTLDRGGHLTFYNGAVDIGQGSTTILTQIAAQALGVPVAAFRLVVGDTDLTFDAGKTSASRQTLVSGNAARLAGLALRRRIAALANAGEDANISIGDGKLVVSDGVAARVIDLSALDADADGVVLEGIGEWDPPTTPLDADGQGVPYASYGFAAQMAEVEVDLALGTVKVIHIEAAHDVGRAVNPTLVEGQIEGGIAQGLGLALMEEFIPGRTENLHDYLIPTIGDVPPITIHLIEDPEPNGPFGAKGVGEPALVATAPAILSAIRHATGARLTRVPVLPHRLHAALKGGTP